MEFLTDKELVTAPDSTPLYRAIKDLIKGIPVKEVAKILAIGTMAFAVGSGILGTQSVQAQDDVRRGSGTITLGGRPPRVEVADVGESEEARILREGQNMVEDLFVHYKGLESRIDMMRSIWDGIPKGARNEAASQVFDNVTRLLQQGMQQA